jgi:hypothetical protein
MSCSAIHYLNRKPEHLVLEGYRAGLTACALQDDAAFQNVRHLFRDAAGVNDPRPLIGTCIDFIAALGRCAVCRLGFFPAGTAHLCRDEALVLALIAAMQHGDEEAGRKAAHALSCAYRAQMLAHTAGLFGIVLKGCGQTLLPVPADVVDGILVRAALSERPPQGQLN